MTGPEMVPTIIAAEARGRRNDFMDDGWCRGWQGDSGVLHFYGTEDDTRGDTRCAATGEFDAAIGGEDDIARISGALRCDAKQ